MRWPGRACAGSLPCDGTDEQSHRRGARGGSQAAEGGWPRARAQALALAVVEAAGELDRQPDGQAEGIAEVQPEVGTCLSAAGGIPAFLGVPLVVLGGSIPAGLVYQGDAF